jgi:hypothetical protein
MPGSTRVRVVLIAAVLTASYAGYQWWASPERQIRRTVREAVAALDHDEPDTSVSALSGVAGLHAILALDVSVEDGSTAQAAVRGRQDVVAMAARVRITTPTLRLQVFDERVSLHSETRAGVEMTVQVTMTDREGAEVADARQVSVELVSVDGRWLVSRVMIAPRAVTA